MRDDNTNTHQNSKRKRTPKKLSERYLKNSGEYYLNRFPASSAHFLTVMTRKIDRSCRVYPDQNRTEWITHIKEVVIPYFEKLGFLNDTLYSQGLFNSLQRRGLSRNEIYRRMNLKGIEKDTIAELLNNHENPINDKDAVLIFAKKKKIGKFRLTPTDDPKEKQKDLGKLARAGFSYDTAITVFD